MNTYQADVHAVIDASPTRVYAILADYNDAHPAILPRQYFTNIEVVKGGQGTGTEFTVDMNVLGARSQYRMTVSEPQPGRVLKEEDRAAGVLTTFTVEPIGDGSQARVTISTTAKAGTGMKGWWEARISAAVLRRIYREELALLQEYVRRTA